MNANVESFVIQKIKKHIRDFNKHVWIRGASTDPNPRELIGRYGAFDEISNIISEHEVIAGANALTENKTTGKNKKD